jgi:hypothetical protein
MSRSCLVTSAVPIQAFIARISIVQFRFQIVGRKTTSITWRMIESGVLGDFSPGHALLSDESLPLERSGGFGNKLSHLPLFRILFLSARISTPFLQTVQFFSPRAVNETKKQGKRRASNLLTREYIFKKTTKHQGISLLFNISS